MTNTSTEVSFASTKPHFEILDGLRGVAAIAVVIFHFMEISVPNPANNFIENAYLAVDFFFCLSGFVIAYAYDEKFAKIGIGNFLKMRIIRLHPLVITGAVIGILCFLVDPFSDLYQKYSGNLAALFLTACFMIPYPIVPERYNNLFHLNPPTWSLFWEYIANILYAFALVKVRHKLLWVLVIIATIALIWEAQAYGNLGGGWGKDNIPGGGIRMAFSFLAGMLVYRSQWIIRTRLNFIAISLLLLAAFMVPYRNAFNAITHPLIVILYFPFIVALGAGAHLGDRLKAICRFSGNISYPLYMVHYPFIWWFFSYVQKYKPGMDQIIPIIIVGLIALILFASAILKWVDVPVRRWLKNRFAKGL